MSHGELQLGNPILNPIKAHVAGLGELLLDGPIGETYGDLIVAMYRRWGLGVSKIGEDLTLLVGDFGGGKGARMFSLLNGGAHDGNASGMDGDIWGH